MFFRHGTSLFQEALDFIQGDFVIIEVPATITTVLLIKDSRATDLDYKAIMTDRL